MGLQNRTIRFGEFDVSNIIEKWAYTSTTIKDKEGMLNSALSSVNIVRSGSASGEFNVPEYKEERVLQTIIDNYDGTTYNKDFHQFPAILTKYKPGTKNIVSVTVFPNCTISKTSLNEPDEKKQQKTITYSWEAEDVWDFTSCNYIYVDKITATKDTREYDLSKSLKNETTPILLCMINYETQPEHFYSVVKDTDSYKLKISEDVILEDGDKILVVYETDSTTLL